MKRTVVYLAHPVGQEPERGENLRRAERWLRWAIEHHPDNAFAMPWLPYCHVLTEEHRERGIRDDLAILGRCDQIWLVGGHVSAGMAMERTVAEAIGLTVFDMTHLGAEPPTEEVAAL